MILVYNNETTIGSLLKQICHIDKLFHIELMIFFTISKDNSWQIIERRIHNFKNYRIYKIKQTEFNHSAIRNLAAKRAKGNYICFLSGDVNIKTVDFVDRFYKSFDCNKNTVAIYGKQIPKYNCNYHSKLENYCIFFNLDKKVDSNGVYIQGKKYRLMNSYQDYFISNVFACYHRSFLLKYPFPDKNQCEDLAIGKLIIDAGKNIMYDSRAIVIHSHNYSLREYYNIQKESLIIKYKEPHHIFGSSFKCKLFYIFNSEDSLIIKIYNFLIIIFYYLVKIVAYFNCLMNNSWAHINKKWVQKSKRY